MISLEAPKKGKRPAIAYSTETGEHAPTLLRNWAQDELQTYGNNPRLAAHQLHILLRKAPHMWAALAGMYLKDLAMKLVLDALKSGAIDGVKTNSSTPPESDANHRPPQGQKVSASLSTIGASAPSGEAIIRTPSGLKKIASPENIGASAPGVGAIGAAPSGHIIGAPTPKSPHEKSAARRKAEMSIALATANKAWEKWTTDLGPLRDRTKSELQALSNRSRRAARFYSMVADSMPEVGTVADAFSPEQIALIHTIAQGNEHA